MEEGFARVIFQQIFIEQPHLPGPGINTVPVLTGLDPGRGPVERVGVGGWGTKGERSFLFLGRGPGMQGVGGLNLSLSRLEKTEVSAQSPCSHSFLGSLLGQDVRMPTVCRAFRCVGWAGLGSGMEEAEAGHGGWQQGYKRMEANSCRESTWGSQRLV